MDQRIRDAHRVFHLLPSLQEYVLVHQERACVEIYRRRTNWEKEVYEPDTEITLESVGVSLPVAAFYKRVQFGDLAR